jgi:PleD family two-component response regulator
VHYPGASVGVVQTTEGERDAVAILKRADAAMYAAKQHRRARATAP